MWHGESTNRDYNDADEDDEDDEEVDELRRGREMWFARNDDGLWATFVTVCDALNQMFVDRHRMIYHEFVHEVMSAPASDDEAIWQSVFQAARRTAGMYALDVDPCSLDAYVNKMLA